ncbi:PAS domain S-box protein [Desertivirga xinjiangensis]|uniref:PAS domain S-box protein n=1 Tax=Desertivirga xinjiangensis TaxID=539206 RepID=UPI00210AF854|nr:PAS domain S-box protein [Pedobacter xinjiangensis]
MMGLKRNTNEKERLDALFNYHILDTAAEKEFDAITRLASYICQTPVAFISLVDESRQWFKSKIGFELSETRRDQSLCHYTIQKDSILEIQDIHNDPYFSKKDLGAFSDTRFYAGAPLIGPEGQCIGTVCVADNLPKKLSDEQRDALQILAGEVVCHLETQKKNWQLQALVNRHEQMFSIFNNSPELHAILDDQGSILMVNKSVEHLLGYSVEEMLGKNIWSYCQPGDRDRVMPGIEAALARGETDFRLETRILCKSGEYKWFAWHDTKQTGRWLINGRDVTDQKKITDELELLSLAANKSASGVLIRDDKNRVLWMNKAFENITGYTLDELRGHVFGDSLIGKDTDLKVVEHAKLALKEKRPYEIEVVLHKKDKSPIWLYICNNPIFGEDGSMEKQIAIAVDITLRKQAEEQVKLLSLVASKTANGVIITDKDGKVTWVNDSFTEITGYTLEDVLSRRAGDLLLGAGTNMDELAQVRELSAQRKPYNLETLNYRKDNEPVWLSVSNTPVFDDNGNVIRQIEIINDITLRKYAEFELIRAKEEALQLSKAKEMFLSVMSHEIRTPLNAVLGLSRVLYEENTSESQAESLSLLNFSAENLMALINDILDLTKIETGNLELEQTEVALKDLISKTMSSVQFKAVEKGIAFNFEIDANVPELIKGDDTRLYQIMMNILGNSLKFTEKGEIKLKLDMVKETQDSVSLKFQISDTGIGIPADKLGQIFEVYKQAGADTTRKYGGTGLGLSITKKLIELHHSEIFVESKIGEGTKFTFTIEFQKANQQALNKKIEITQQLKGTVLVADDNQINCFLARKVLSKWGIDVEFAENGKVAVEKVLKKNYNLVLMDIQMPEMDGFEATDKIRKLAGGSYRDLPIIALTASISSADVENIGKAGMNDYLLKPFNPGDLYSKIENYFQAAG